MYGYVVAGAGCVVAARLTEDPGCVRGAGRGGTAGHRHGSTNAPTTMIAEKAADPLKAAQP